MSQGEKKASRLAVCGVMCALSIVVAVIESLLPLQAIIPIPGIKPGFANVIIMYLLFRYGFIEALTVSLIRCAAVNLLFGSVTGLLFSVSGALLSILCGFILKRTAADKLSFVGVSVSCAAAHNIGQTAAACAVLSSAAPFSYLTVLLASSVITGSVTGVVLNAADKRLKRI